MPDRPAPARPAAPFPGETANQRLKSSFSNRLWGAMIVATVLHFSLFALWPSMSVRDIALAHPVPEMIDLPDEVDLPPEPEEIPHPARPVVADVPIDEDVTIGSTDWKDNPVAPLAPPPAEEPTELSRQPVFTPHTVAPRLMNREEVEQVLVDEYPRTLEDAAIGGTVSVHVFIDETGAVQNVQVHEGSGYAALDEAALDVARIMRFSPAMNQNRAVPVWILQAIRFVSREQEASPPTRR